MPHGNHEWLFVILYSPLLILLREPLLFDRDLCLSGNLGVLAMVCACQVIIASIEAIMYRTVLTTDKHPSAAISRVTKFGPCLHSLCHSFSLSKISCYD